MISERSERDEDELQFRASQITENPKQFIELMRTFACDINLQEVITWGQEKPSDLRCLAIDLILIFTGGKMNPVCEKQLKIDEQ